MNNKFLYIDEIDKYNQYPIYFNSNDKQYNLIYEWNAIKKDIKKLYSHKKYIKKYIFNLKYNEYILKDYSNKFFLFNTDEFIEISIDLGLHKKNKKYNKNIENFLGVDIKKKENFNFNIYYNFDYVKIIDDILHNYVGYHKKNEFRKLCFNIFIKESINTFIFYDNYNEKYSLTLLIIIMLDFLVNNLYYNDNTIEYLLFSKYTNSITSREKNNFTRFFIFDCLIDNKKIEKYIKDINLYKNINNFIVLDCTYKKTTIYNHIQLKNYLENNNDIINHFFSKSDVTKLNIINLFSNKYIFYSFFKWIFYYK